MRKIFLILFALASFASADYLFQPESICVKDFWFNNGSFFYVRSDTGATVTGTTDNYGDDFFAHYEYNATTKNCKKEPLNNELGLENNEYNYFMALTGLLTGTLLVSALFIGLRVS